MSATEEDEGPRLVWTFPLIRILTRRRRIFDIASRMRQENGGVVNRVQERVDNVTSESDNELDTNDEELEDIENQITSISEDSSLVFEQDEDSDADITIGEGVFVPTTVEIEVGETVEWENEDDSVHNVMSIEGEDFSSGQLDPGDTFSHTFDEEEVVIFIDSIFGGDVMCGAVLVGDVELEQELPCEEDVTLELFDSDDEDVRTMDQAAEEKQDLIDGIGQ